MFGNFVRRRSNFTIVAHQIRAPLPFVLPERPIRGNPAPRTNSEGVADTSDAFAIGADACL
jgi:hypothetical protein